MVPGDFILLEAMPLLPNGKINRGALAIPEADAGAPSHRSDKARTPSENQLVTIWSEVLGATDVGVHDNFLELGGNSLHAARVIVRILDTFHVELPLGSIFESPTIVELAVAIDSVRADKTACGITRIARPSNSTQRTKQV